MILLREPVVIEFDITEKEEYLDTIKIEIKIESNFSYYFKRIKTNMWIYNNDWIAQMERVKQSQVFIIIDLSEELSISLEDDNSIQYNYRNKLNKYNDSFGIELNKEDRHNLCGNLLNFNSERWW